MLSEYYWIAITLAVIAFTSINLISKALLNKKNTAISYKSFIPLYTAFSAVAAIIVALLILHTISIGATGLVYAALMGFIYVAAAYIVFFSLENEQIVIIGAINASQFIILSFFSAVIFLPVLVLKDSVPLVLMLAGVVLLSIRKGKKTSFSKFAILALLGNIMWVIMWLIFYATIKTVSSPFIYYTWITIFAAVFSLVLAPALKTKRKDLRHILKSRKLSSYILYVGIANGVGSMMFSFAYNINGVLSPLLTQITIPAIAVLAFVLLKEKLRLTEILGMAAIIGAVFMLVLA